MVFYNFPKNIFESIIDTSVYFRDKQEYQYNIFIKMLHSPLFRSALYCAHHEQGG